ncbi:hypothetical protein D3Z52_18845 [Clostridiaceae bacterium]|nr:hypothetical protein [Clostridiaceae bacterium]NBI82764.1 hypothetical protein [Clostridiaceae bacterium]RKJ81953.1 hypothetical protein D7X33_03205 [Butyricicoccus sp. 1XD8-22]
MLQLIFYGGRIFCVLRLAGGASCADSGRALPCTRNFFEKKLSKSFITPAGGTGNPQPLCLQALFQVGSASI